VRIGFKTELGNLCRCTSELHFIHILAYDSNKSSGRKIPCPQRALSARLAIIATGLL
jgi:hypothetical protein